MELTARDLIQIFCAMLGSISFAMLFNVHGKKLIIAALGGLITWAVYLFFRAPLHNEMAQYFAAAVSATIFAEVFARVMKAPTTVFLVSAIIPLIPGGMLYYTMNSAINGDFDGFVRNGAETIGIAIAIAAGILFVTSLFTIYISMFRWAEYQIKSRKYRREHKYKI